MVNLPDNSRKNESLEEEDEKIDSPGDNRVINSDLDVIVVEDELEVLQLGSGDEFIALLDPCKVQVSSQSCAMVPQLSLELAPHAEDVSSTGFEFSCELAVNAID